MGFFPIRFWTFGLEDTSCTVEEMSDAVEGAFFVRFSDYKTFPRGIANMTCTKF